LKELVPELFSEQATKLIKVDGYIENLSGPELLAKLHEGLDVQPL